MSFRTCNVLRKKIQKDVTDFRFFAIMKSKYVTYISLAYDSVALLICVINKNRQQQDVTVQHETKCVLTSWEGTNSCPTPHTNISPE